MKRYYTVIAFLVLCFASIIKANAQCYQPIVINYPTNACQDVTAKLSLFSASNLDGLSFTWTVPGGVIVGPANGSTIDVKWSTTGLKTASVTAMTQCGALSATISPSNNILVHNPSQVGTLSTSIVSACGDASVVLSLSSSLGYVKYRFRRNVTGTWTDWTEFVNPSFDAILILTQTAYEFQALVQNANCPWAESNIVTVNLWGPPQIKTNLFPFNYKTICSNQSTSIIPYSYVPDLPGYTFSWTATISGSISGVPTSGSGNINHTPINTGTNTAYVTYSIIATATATGCVSSVESVTLEVMPKINLGPLSPKTICSGQQVNYDIDIVDQPNGITYLNWPDPDGVGPATGAVNKVLSNHLEITDVLVNNTTSPVVVVYQINPSYNNFPVCTGTTSNLSITVNPKPVMTSASAVTTCSGTTMNFPLTSNVPSTFSWLANSSAIGGESTTTQNTSFINNTLTNNYLSIVNVAYFATPTSLNGCIGNVQNLTVSVKPTETIENFNALPTKTYGNAAFTMNASVNHSGSAVSYTTSNPSVATVSGNTVTITGAGSTTITAASTGTNAGFCLAASVAQALTINKAVITTNASNATRTYGATNPSFAINYSGFVNGDNASAIDTPPVATTAASGSSDVGGYPISITGGSDNNYTFSNGSGTLTISKASLSATSSATKTYGAVNPALPINYSGFVNGENSSVIDSPPSASTSVGQSTNVGNYSINLSVGLDNNYLINLIPGNFSITQAALTATANNASKYSGQPNPPFSVSYSGFVNGENSSVIDVLPVTSTTATTNSAAGSYPISISGGVDNNYSITHVNGTLTVQQAPTCSVNITTSGNLCTQGRVLLTASVSGGTASSFSWSTGETVNRIYVYWGGDYTVTVNFTNGCSTTQTIHVNDASGPGCIYYLMAEPEPIILSTSIFPNPADTELSIELPDEFLSQFKESITVIMIDQIGKIAFTSSFEKGQKKIKIDTKELTNGLYFLQLGNKNSGLVRQKIMIVHNN